MKNIDKLQIRDAFIHGVLERAEADREVILISNDFGAPALDSFRENFPKQFINSGISEQNIITVAAAMANEGKKVFVYSIASFITLRCLEQIKLDICVHNAPVTIMAGGTGLSYAEDGPTHHALEDISLMQALSGMEIYSPSDALAAYDTARFCCDNPVPAYIRLDKGKMPVLEELLPHNHTDFRTSNTSTDLLLLSTGFMTHRALEVAAELKTADISCNVIDLNKIHPLPDALKTLLKTAAKIVSIEEHCSRGGIGTLLGEVLLDSETHPGLKRIAIEPDKLYCYGSRDKLHRDFGLDTAAIVSLLKEW